MVQKFLYSTLLITICSTMVLILYDTWTTYEMVDAVLSVSIVYVIAVYVNYVYYHIKVYGWIRGQYFRAKQNQVTSQLAKSMAHAIRNPLTVARGFVQLVSGKQLISEQVHAYCEHAQSGMQEADAVITDYLRCAELKIKTPHRLHVQKEIDEKIIPQITPRCAQSQIEIIVHHLTEKPMYIEGEWDMLYRTILNIVTNAVEAMPTGGKLEVTTWLDGGIVHIHIEDTGIGMDRQKMKRIGMPFYDDMREKGTGLGLMVVLSLVEAMNGTISYYSRPNEGTACWLKYKHA